MFIGTTSSFAPKYGVYPKKVHCRFECAILHAHNQAAACVVMRWIQKKACIMQAKVTYGIGGLVGEDGFVSEVGARGGGGVQGRKDSISASDGL
jgi:hypothetical protein